MIISDFIQHIHTIILVWLLRALYSLHVAMLWW